MRKIPKTFKPIIGFDHYYINKRGKVLSFFRNKVFLLKNHRTKFGYENITLYKNSKPYTIFIHKLVCLTFNGENIDKKYGVNHKDGNKLNNHFKNLEWSTPKENIEHSIKLGLQNLNGTNNPNSKTTKDELICIKVLFEKGLSNKEISNILCIPNARIKNYRSKIQ